ncbi:hypothetical protein P389DRAFT_56448 [Cystobasidium minutum MCA 4210]|uniref:uncharacterized protein n=1 Tax=Cystobasidium minutum MCA 4210 TaxID=1397322 RepID=UPI0034CE543A|eukprot:jgi/Rhomi1/56448/CE56447_1041
MSRAAAANRHSARELGRFTSQATLRANQRALLAPVARWRKEPVKLGNSNIRVTKWVKWVEEGGEDDQVTEEQLSASVDGANSFLQPAAAPTAATSATPTAVNTPAVNTPGINTSGSQTPLIAIKPENTSLSIPGAEATTDQSLLQPASLTNAPLITSPLAANTESAVVDAASAETSAAGPSDTLATVRTDVSVTAPTQETDTNPGEADDGSNMQVETEQREYDTNMAPELQGAEAEQTRTLLGVGDPVGGGPQEIVDQS